MTTVSLGRSLAVGVLLVTAGCVGGLGGGGGVLGGPLSFSAAPVHVSEQAVAETPFEQVTDEPVTFERTLEVQGQSQTVEMNAHMVQLERTYQGAPLGTMVILSLPQVRILGQQVNVIERVGVTSLISRARSESGELERDQKIDEFQTPALGSNRTVEVFRGTASREGRETKARIYVTTFDHRGDTIVGVSIVPESAGSERGAVSTVLGGVEYEGDDP
jgi:hypothetical protein